MKHGRCVDKENIISYNRNFVRRLRLRALTHCINTTALLKRGQATRAVILLPFQKVAAAVLHQCPPCLITLVLHRHSGNDIKQLLAEDLFLGENLSICSAFGVLPVTLRCLRCLLQQELGDSSSTAELPMVCSLRHLLLKMWSHKIPLRLVGWQSMDLCSNRLSLSADKQKPKW